MRILRTLSILGVIFLCGATSRIVWAEDIKAYPTPSIINISEKDKQVKEQSTPKKKVASAPVEKKKERLITVKAYAYCINGRTASGEYTRKGCIAVDPRVIPLGKKIYVPGYGWGKSMDTGGSVRGNVIDIWYPSRSECMQWGVRTVTIKVAD
ncbi:3D domain-containing protein [bacterium]|nr:3D domain-containing protein [bacterium]